MPNRSKEKGDRFEREIVHQAEAIGLKAHRHFLSRSETSDAHDVNIAGREMQCKKEAAGFRRIRQWMEGTDGLIIGSDRERSLVVVRLEDWLKLL